MVSAIGVAMGAASVCWESMDGTGVYQEGRAHQIVDELFHLVRKYAGKENGPEPEELAQKIALVTHAGGVRMVIGEATIVDEEIHAIIPLAALQEGIVRSLRADAPNGMAFRKTEIHFKPAEMVTGVLFPTDLRFQINHSQVD